MLARLIKSSAVDRLRTEDDDEDDDEHEGMSRKISVGKFIGSNSIAL